MLRLKPILPITDRNHPDSKNLILDLPFWERGGGTVKDVSGNGNHGTLVANASGIITNWIVSDFGPSVLFDELDGDHCNIPSFHVMDGSHGTISCIMRAPIENQRASFSEANEIGTTDYLIVRSNSSAYANVNHVSASGGTIVNKNGTMTIYGDGKFHSVDLVRDGTSLSLYVDGSLDFSVITSIPGTAFTRSSIGRLPWGSSPFYSTIECAAYRAWNRSLTSQEIAARYADPNRHYVKQLQDY